MVSDLLSLAQLAIGTVLILSAAGKLANPRAFARGVMEYRILPGRLAFALGLIL
jgi:hypothetical protein